VCVNVKIQQKGGYSGWRGQLGLRMGRQSRLPSERSRTELERACSRTELLRQEPPTFRVLISCFYPIKQFRDVVLSDDGEVIDVSYPSDNQETLTLSCIA
jgi:hypothetical protein